MRQQKEYNPKHNVQIPLELLYHKGVTGNMLKVYAYMKFRYQFFTIKKKMSYFESLETISERVSISKRTTNDCIIQLERWGFIQKLDKKERFGKSCIYKVVDCLIKSQPDKITYYDEKDYEGDPF